MSVGTSLIRPPHDGAHSFTGRAASPPSATPVHAFASTARRTSPPAPLPRAEHHHLVAESGDGHAAVPPSRRAAEPVEPVEP
ncbi:hypothetical protein [Streptomyces lushanensis]|uniref:hypothetical protein n=1 Tax=Streptomyces lushanensis TaxID=1434255 RepID=UPI0014744766|nr:hypothetical protein [Streptomyces lushanensis]